jgi:hypothetical protein
VAGGRPAWRTAVERGVQGVAAQLHAASPHLTSARRGNCMRRAGDNGGRLLYLDNAAARPL